MALSCLFYSCENEVEKTSYPSIIELITQEDSSVEKGKLTAFFHNNEIQEGAIYRWQNHWALYVRLEDVGKIVQKLKVSLPGAVIKSYVQPFYIFDRKMCDDSSATEEWDNILLTANLVKDTDKQAEYMEYHRTQFENWPEVAQGFCNASFQQLLVFREGRRLMLVIRIPKGENLDELNPKTTEDNPRVDEWNALMSKYQEGLEEAPEGVTWIFLDQKSRFYFTN